MDLSVAVCSPYAWLELWGFMWNTIKPNRFFCSFVAWLLFILWSKTVNSDLAQVSFFHKFGNLLYRISYISYYLKPKCLVHWNAFLSYCPLMWFYVSDELNWRSHWQKDFRKQACGSDGILDQTAGQLCILWPFIFFLDWRIEDARDLWCAIQAVI